MYLGIVLSIAKTKGADQIPGNCTLLFSIGTVEKVFSWSGSKQSMCRVYFSKYNENQYLFFFPDY